MIIVKIHAGLGNQMFQYALYKSLIHMDKDVRLDIDSYQHYNCHNGYELSKIFNVYESFADKRDVNKLSNERYDILTRAIRRYINPKYRNNRVTHYKQEISKSMYNKQVFDLDNVYLDGYWQSEKYFQHIREEILNDFFFKNRADINNKKYIDIINETNSVSLHIRRGDYISNPLLKDITTTNYYLEAIDYINNFIKKPVFFIFSDDIDWCKENFKIKDGHLININKGDMSYNDMRLMSLCKHNIIANSTFSWWGAWLNRNKNKIVIAPEIWFSKTDMNSEDIIPKKWKIISS